MTHYIFLTLLALVIAGCSGTPAQTTDHVDSQILVNKASHTTIMPMEPTFNINSTDISIPALTVTPAKTAAQSAHPTQSSTPTPT